MLERIRGQRKLVEPVMQPESAKGIVGDFLREQVIPQLKQPP